MKLVLVKAEKCTFIAFDFGETEYNGKKYRLVSPYLDNRAKHWLDLTTKCEDVCEINP